MNDNDERAVTIIIARVRRSKGGRWEGVHVLLAAPDDDTAVRAALTALTREGYVALREPLKDVTHVVVTGAQRLSKDAPVTVQSTPTTQLAK